MSKTNPNGANQYTTDPRQVLFLTHYIDPKSETFSNALQSALKAGYSQEYAENITNLMPDWLSDAIGDSKRLKRAEKKLDEILEIPSVDQEGKHDNGLIANQIKVATLYAKGLGKAKYSERTELTGKDGIELPQPLLYVLNNNSDKEDSETE